MRTRGTTHSHSMSITTPAKGVVEGGETRLTAERLATPLGPLSADLANADKVMDERRARLIGAEIAESPA